MKTYWLTFTDGSQGCCDGGSEYDAKMISEHFTKKTVAGGKYQDIAAIPLPYHANPIIWQLDHPIYGKSPAFCMYPKTCAGKGSCPREYSCTN